MAGPLDGARVVHAAFRTDIRQIDEAALDAARGKPGLDDTVARFRFLNEVLEWHSIGEEQGVFPIIEAVAPSVADTYELDHRAQDASFEVLNDAVSADDAIATARATSAFRHFLEVHLDKEDQHLYPMIADRVPVEEQAKAAGIMAGAVPQDRFPEFVAWLFPLIDDDDRELMTRIWLRVMPPEVFERTTGLVAAAVPDAWPELQQRIPELTA